MPPVEDQLKHALGLGRNIGPARLADGYLEPTLNVRAIHVGDEGPTAANAVATQADASFDFRLAPGETPEHTRELLENYLTRQDWFIVRDEPDLETRLCARQDRQGRLGPRRRNRDQDLAPTCPPPRP